MYRLGCQHFRMLSFNLICGEKIMSLFRKIFLFQQKLSFAFDRILPHMFYHYGSGSFRRLVPEYLQEGQKIYDMGSGKVPSIMSEYFEPLRGRLHVTAVDIDPGEIMRAPEGFYSDHIICDITKTPGSGDGDLILSRAMLEHVVDSRAALENMATYIKPGGRIIFFAPCRNSAFARLNMILPEELKKKLLGFLYGEKAETIGFRAYYDRCTPREMERSAHEIGLEVEKKMIFYNSNYFTFFLPVHVLWRLYQLLVIVPFGLEQLCEGFVYVLRKPLRDEAGVLDFSAAEPAILPAPAQGQTT